MQWKMKGKLLIFITVLLSVLLTGCSSLVSNQLIINRYGDALLTKNNELQFRFRVNSKILSQHELYKVKVTIHDEKLASAIGKREMIYGEDQVVKGEYLEATSQKEKFIFMTPIPLKIDLHIDELRKMIEENHAVSIEVFNDREVLGRAYLTNFSSEL